MAEAGQERSGQVNDEAAGASPRGGGKGTIVVLLVGLAVVVLAPVASYVVVRMSLEPREPRVSRDTVKPGATITYSIKSLIVNVSGTRMTRVLRMTPNLIVSDGRMSEVLDEMKPLIKDRIITVASRRTLDELETVNDREVLKRDIVNEINGLIRDRMAGSVLDVAFSEFLIQ